MKPLPLLLLTCSVLATAASAHGPRSASRGFKHARQVSPAERTQSAYLTTKGNLATGTTVRAGRAHVEVLERDGKPEFTLELSLVGGAEDVAVRMVLGESLANTAGIEFDGSVTSDVQMSVRYGHDGNRVGDTLTQGNATLSWSQVGDTRPRLAGTIRTAAGGAAFNFDTEYDLECFAPEPTAKAGSTAGPELAGRELVSDDDFESHFCKQFEELR